MEIGLVIHGGAGTIPESVSHSEIKDSLSEITHVGQTLLLQGKRSVEVVVEVCTLLEDCPLFNAGRGSVMTEDGTFELEASIMDGKTLDYGAAIGLKQVKNPIRLSECIMKDSKHNVMFGEGAERFAKAYVEMVSQEYFKSLKKSNEIGTIGCVALDAYQNLSAGTSTGGIVGKSSGRVGDSAIIGAGNYANNQCAVSCTGEGEAFIRAIAAYDLACLLRYKSMSLKKAAERVIENLNGQGGLIAIDAQGNVACKFNTKNLCRGWVDKGKVKVKLK